MQSGRWCVLFDELCNRAGYFDDAALASAYCKRIGRNGRTNFDTVQKNLRQWRQGRRVPLRRNVIVLADLLGIAPGSALHHRWSYLYAVARGGDPARIPHPEFSDSANAAEPTRGPNPLREAARWAAIAACALVGTLSANAAYEGWRFERLPLIDFQSHVKLAVGDSRLINGLRGDCGASPPDWYYSRTLVPQSKIGTFSDGGLARKNSVSCGQIISARAARFTATRVGVEQIKLMGDLFTIEVVDDVVAKQK